VEGDEMSIESNIEKKKQQGKVDSILNHYVMGEAYILTPPSEWKKIVLRYFNYIQQEKITLMELVDRLEKEGVQYNQSKNLVKYPIKECLLHIAKVANKTIEI
jgi:hypothetical protein